MRRMTWMPITLLVLASVAPAVLGDDRNKGSKAGPKDGTVVDGPLGRDLDRAVTDTSKDFWGSVLVARQGKVALAKGYGLQDYKEKRNSPLSLFERRRIRPSWTDRTAEPLGAMMSIARCVRAPPSRG